MIKPSLSPNFSRLTGEFLSFVFRDKSMEGKVRKPMATAATVTTTKKSWRKVIIVRETKEA